MKGVYWTFGRYDMIAAMEGPDDASVTALTLAMSVMGNIQTQTLRAFGVGEMKQILEKLA